MENEQEHFACENCHGPVHPDMLLCEKCYADKLGNYVDNGTRKYNCLTCKNFMFEEDAANGGILPDWCYLYCHNCCTMEELLEDYSADQRQTLSKYANKYDMSILRAVEYQTHCHYCGKTIHNAEFHESDNQYCKSTMTAKGGYIDCEEACEQFNYPCFRGSNCHVCGSWYEKNRRAELKRNAPVLAAISAFKEHRVYAQFFECLPDLVEYFD